MVYLRSISAGIATSIGFLIVLAVVAGVMSRHREGFVAISIFGPIPLTVALVGFAAGFYMVLRISS